MALLDILLQLAGGGGAGLAAFYVQQHLARHAEATRISGKLHDDRSALYAEALTAVDVSLTLAHDIYEEIFEYLADLRVAAAENDREEVESLNREWKDYSARALEITRAQDVDRVRSRLVLIGDEDVVTQYELVMSRLEKFYADIKAVEAEHGNTGDIWEQNVTNLLAPFKADRVRLVGGLALAMRHSLEVKGLSKQLDALVRPFSATSLVLRRPLLPPIEPKDKGA